MKVHNFSLKMVSILGITFFAHSVYAMKTTESVKIELKNDYGKDLMYRTGALGNWSKEQLFEKGGTREVTAGYPIEIRTTGSLSMWHPLTDLAEKAGEQAKERARSKDKKPSKPMLVIKPTYTFWEVKTEWRE